MSYVSRNARAGALLLTEEEDWVVEEEPVFWMRDWAALEFVVGTAVGARLGGMM